MSEDLIDVYNEILVIFAIHFLYSLIILQESVNEPERGFPEINWALLFDGKEAH